MSLGRMSQVLLPLYQTNDPAHRAEYAELLVAQALRYAEREAAPKLDEVEALARLLAARDTLRQLKRRGPVEACLIELGWTDPRVRDLWRALDRLPDKPQSIEERLVADAHTVLHLGVGGLVRQAQQSGARGESPADCLKAVHKNLGRRLYTAAASGEAIPLKDELRALWTKLDSE
jgi:hypothetical protein